MIPAYPGRRATGTTGQVLEFYNTYNRRPTVEDAGARATIFRSFRRSLKGLLPQDLSTPILDIACGEGALLCYLRELGYSNLAGCDLSPENVMICRRLGLAFVEQADALNLSGMPGLARYGAIFAMDMLEHLPKQRAAGFLEQLRGLLLPGGCLVIQTMNMGSLPGWFHRYSDVTHEFGLTERSAATLMQVAGFRPERIEVRSAWNATTAAGRLREVYLRVLHQFIWIAEGATRPRIPTRNILVRASVP